MSGRYAVMFFRNVAYTRDVTPPFESFIMPSGRFPGCGLMSVPSGTTFGSFFTKDGNRIWVLCYGGDMKCFNATLEIGFLHIPAALVSDMSELADAYSEYAAEISKTPFDPETARAWLDVQLAAFGLDLGEPRRNETEDHA